MLNNICVCMTTWNRVVKCLFHMYVAMTPLFSVMTVLVGPAPGTCGHCVHVSVLIHWCMCGLYVHAHCVYVVCAAQEQEQLY